MDFRSRDDPPLVSVILPTYDRPDRLVTAARSVADQTYPNVELVVVDDASPTPARETLVDEPLGDLDWRCFRHDENRGANAARNTGIRESEGEVVAFLDDDDAWLPEKIEAQVALFEAGGEDVGVALVGQKYTYEGEVTTIRRPTVEGDATRGLLSGETAGTFPTIAVRRSVIDRAGLPDERFPAWQDREWLVRLSRHCEFAADRRPLVVGGSGEYDQIGDAYEEKRDVSYPLFIEKHRELAAEYGIEDAFVASLTVNLASAAIQNGYAADARRLSMEALRIDPLRTPAWMFLALSLVPRGLYRSVVRLKREAVRFRSRLETEAT